MPPMPPTTAGAVVIVLIAILHIKEKQSDAGEGHKLQELSPAGVNVFTFMISAIGSKLGGIGFSHSQLEIPFPLNFSDRGKASSVGLRELDKIYSLIGHSNPGKD